MGTGDAHNTPKADQAVSLAEIMAYLEAEGLRVIAKSIRLRRPSADLWMEWVRDMIRSHPRLQGAGARPLIAREIKAPESGADLAAAQEHPQTLQPVRPSAEVMRRDIEQVTAIPAYRAALDNTLEHRVDIRAFIEAKWRDIQSDRRVFGLAREKAYPVETAIGALRRIGLRVFEYSRSDTPDTEVQVRLITRTDDAYAAALDRAGEFQFDGRFMDLFPAECRESYRLLLHLATVVHYADLLIPSSGQPQEQRTTGVEPSTHTRPTPAPDVVTKSVPRLPQAAHASDGHGNSMRGASFVDPFRRRLPPGQKPSFGKIIEADQFGIHLHGPGYPDINYTFVRGHTRGGEAPPEYRYAQNYRAVPGPLRVPSRTDLEWNWAGFGHGARFGDPAPTKRREADSVSR